MRERERVAEGKETSLCLPERNIDTVIIENLQVIYAYFVLDYTLSNEYSHYLIMHIVQQKIISILHILHEQVTAPKFLFFASFSFCSGTLVS